MASEDQVTHLQVSDQELNLPNLIPGLLAFFFFFFRDKPWAYGSSQARG